MLTYYINEFVVFSFLGWVYESIFCTVRKHHWQNRGFLFGPVCPIYGTCVVLGDLLVVVLPEQAAFGDGGHEGFAVHEEAEEHDGELFVLFEVGGGVGEVFAVGVGLAEFDEGFAHQVFVGLPATGPLLGVASEVEVVGQAAQVLVVEELAVGGFLLVGGAEFLLAFFDDALGDFECFGQEGDLQDAELVDAADVVFEVFHHRHGVDLVHLVGVEGLQYLAS